MCERVSYTSDRYIDVSAITSGGLGYIHNSCKWRLVYLKKAVVDLKCFVSRQGNLVQ